MLGINTNFASLSAQKNLRANGVTLETSIDRLSSGLRVNNAKDDAAGLAIAERMNAQVRAFNVSARNASDGTSFLQVADGTLGKLTDNLQRMRELAVQAKNGVLTSSDRQNLNREFTELASEVGRLTEGATYNTVSLFTDANKSLILQVGAGNSGFDTLSVNLTTDGTTTGDALQTVLGATNPGTISADVAANFGDILTVGSVGTGGAADGIARLDSAIDAITTIRATVGANLSRLDQVVASLDTASTNLATARGRIMDADYARETAALTRTQILQQAGTAMLAQANQLPNQVLSLLK